MPDTHKILPYINSIFEYSMLMTSIIPIGVTNHRNSNIPFGIKEADRFNHIYVIGKTGTGKSTLLLNMAIADIQRGNGLCLIDPHGDIAEKILDYIPQERIADTIYFNPADEEYCIAFNPLDNIPAGKEHLVVAGLIATFKKIWIDSWGPRLEYILRYSLLTLCQYPGATLLDIPPLLINSDKRRKILAWCHDTYLLQFWREEFEKYPPALKAEAISPILNKVGLFTALKTLRNTIGQEKSSFKIHEVMDSKKILICNLSKGRLGEDTSMILGSMLVNAIQLAATERASQAESERIPFYLYIDEMHSFVTVSIADILSEARKYKLSLFLAHQFIEQVDEKIRAAIFGNCGTMIFFRVGAEDARALEQEIDPPFKAEDLINLPRFTMYIKLMIDGATSKPFSAVTMPINVPEHTARKAIITHTYHFYGTAICLIENEHAMRMSKRDDESNKTLFDV
ncbi:MAG: type IV secretion system DNA-binding domain-containing protein [Bacteroidetes bacterium]|nr:type IV secretion system DNA-binding domain-containing protein [Bacteroidota bacterium]